jgi:hypothetical protein
MPSRRALLGAIAVSVLTLGAGCTGTRPANDGTEQSTESTADDGATVTPERTTAVAGGTFEVRLVGSGTDRLLFDGSDLGRVGAVEATHTGTFALPVTLTEAARADVTETFRSAGVEEDLDAFEVVHTYDGEEMGRFGISPSLATAVADGEWDGRIRLTFAEREQATEVRDALVAGSET